MQNKAEAIKEALGKVAADGKLSCTAARKLAADLGVSPKEIGKAADELNIKIFACELGCF